MKTKYREFLLNVKELERKSLENMSEELVYKLKYDKNANVEKLLFGSMNKHLNDSYNEGLRFGKEVFKESNDLLSKLSNEEKKKYVSDKKPSKRGSKILLTKEGAFKLFIAIILIERERFFKLYDLYVNVGLGQGLTMNQATTESKIFKLEYQFINTVRSFAALCIFDYSQAGYFDGLKNK